MPGKIGVVRHPAHAGVSANYTTDVDVYNAVTVTGVKSVGRAGAGDPVVGVALLAEVSGERGTFQNRGDIVPMISGAAVTAGTKVVSDANGKVVAGAGTETAGAVIGIAWTSSTAADQEILIIVL